MDEKTLTYYCQNAHLLFDRYLNAKDGIVAYFDQAFEPGCSVLDIGCGSGRDLIHLIQKGFYAYGLEPCSEFIELAIEKFPQLKNKLFEGSLPSIPQSLSGKKFDAVLCSAVFMHIPEEDLFDSVYSIRNLLNDQGRLLISIPDSRNDLDSSDRDKDGRLMIMRNPWELQLLFERTGFQLITHWENEDSLDREDITWTSMCFKFREEQVLRPIDKIEGVLNRDRKDATYKLALFRAICDIALTEFKGVRVENKKIGIRVDDIVDRWLIYYWPLVEHAIPQKFGEFPDFNRKMAFRSAMEKLIAYYKDNGGLQGFIMDKRSALLNKEAEKLLRKVSNHIRTTILKGPVVYAGGSLQTGRVFEYSTESKRVLFSPDLWREFVLMGHWIKDALILRWAELTAAISKNSKRPSEIIDLLLQQPLPERETADARKIYLAIDNKECVWSGKRLKDEFDVDHAIPFALWMNNDLWNLFPILPTVNNRKRDKLPTTSLVKQRKDVIIDYWKLLRSHMPSRFDYEAARFNGKEFFDLLNWENRLFSHFVEAIEYTAIQRCTERWEP
jgi:SAM-dependent methyltransferase